MFPLVSRLTNPFLKPKMAPGYLLPSRLALLGPKNLAGSVSMPALNKDYWIVHNVLSQEIYGKLSLFTKAPALSARPFREVLPIPFGAKLTFSSTHCLENETQVFKDHKIHDPFLQHLYHQLIHQFAKQMKLIGPHEIYLELNRYTPSSNVVFSQDWHFDRGAFATLIMVLHNDFTYIDEQGGLDISFNGIKGPFNAFAIYNAQNVKPLNEQYVSVPYPDNGAIIVRGDQGNVIHKMSTLAAKTFSSHSPCYRVIAVLLLKDRVWQQQSARSFGSYLSGS